MGRVSRSFYSVLKDTHASTIRTHAHARFGLIHVFARLNRCSSSFRPMCRQYVISVRKKRKGIRQDKIKMNSFLHIT